MISVIHVAVGGPLNGRWVAKDNDPERGHIFVSARSERAFFEYHGDDIRERYRIVKCRWKNGRYRSAGLTQLLKWAKSWVDKTPSA